MYGHIKQMAEAEKRGIEAAGGSVDVYQYVCGHACQLGSQLTAFLRLPETPPEEVLTKMQAPPKDSNIPTLHDPHKLLEYDAFLFGIPTRYGNFPAQWKVRRTCGLQCEICLVTDHSAGILGPHWRYLADGWFLGQVRLAGNVLLLWR